MMNKIPALMLAGCLMVSLAACGGTADNGKPEALREQDPEEVLQEEPEEEIVLTGYTAGALTIRLPEDYTVSADSYSQVVGLADIGLSPEDVDPGFADAAVDLTMNMLTIQRKGETHMVSANDYGMDFGVEFDTQADEFTLQGMVEGMMANLKSQDAKATLDSESAMDYQSFADRQWAHKEVVVTAGGQTVQLDVFVCNLSDAQYSAMIMNLSGGDSAEMIDVVMGGMTIA